jgi:hypothetical protein
MTTPAEPWQAACAAFWAAVEAGPDRGADPAAALAWAKSQGAVKAWKAAAIAARRPQPAPGTSRERRALKALDELFKIDSDPCNPWNQRAMKIIARGLLDTPEQQPAPELAAAMAESRQYREALQIARSFLLDPESSGRRRALAAISKALEGK